MTADVPLQPNYFQRIWELRYFWFSLVSNDVRSRYRRSILGVGWSLLRPLGMTIIFCLVFGTIFNREIATYAPYVLIGMTVWQFMIESIMGGCNSFAVGSSYIRQQKIPHAIFPLRTVLSAGFHFLVALGLALVITVYFKGFAVLGAVAFLPVALLILMILGWSLAIIAGVAQTYFPDTSHLLEIAMQIVFYLTPIMYDTSDFPNRTKFVTILSWNPVNSVLELFRQPLLHGQMPAWNNLAIAVGFAVIAAGVASFLLRRLERTLVFWL